MSTLLFVAGYPVAIVVIARWIPVVRERRTAWFVAHELAVAAIVVGWAIEGKGVSVAVNASWLVIAAAWYLWAPGPGGEGAKSDQHSPRK